MMGKQEVECELFSYRINLEHRVRADHPLRKVLQAVDFGFVREKVAEFYGRNGNVSVDPVVLVKIMFLLFFDNHPSERELMRILPERLDYLFFLGYSLDDKTPNHSVLSKARARWGGEVFEDLFVQTVSQCVQAGLVDGSKLHIDSSLIDANASRDSVLKAGPQLIAALQKAYAAEEQKLDEPSGSARAKEVPRSPALTNTTHLSVTDPDARLATKAGAPSRPRYKHHRAVDDACGVITAVETTGGDVDDGSRLDGLRQQHEAVTGSHVHTVVADCSYGTKENFVRCQELAINSHMGDLKATQKPPKKREGLFKESAFSYDPKSNTYLCPAGQTLSVQCFIQGKQSYQYVTAKGICLSCPLRGQCTGSKFGRKLLRHAKQDLLDAARQQSRSKAARRDRRRRMHLMERSFADAANNHGFKRARWRRLGPVTIANHIIAACQNVRLLISKPSKPKSPALAKLTTFCRQIVDILIPRSVLPARNSLWNPNLLSSTARTVALPERNPRILPTSSFVPRIL